MTSYIKRTGRGSHPLCRPLRAASPPASRQGANFRFVRKSAVYQGVSPVPSGLHPRRGGGIAFRFFDHGSLPLAAEGGGSRRQLHCLEVLHLPPKITKFSTCREDYEVLHLPPKAGGCRARAKRRGSRGRDAVLSVLRASWSLALGLCVTPFSKCHSGAKAKPIAIESASEHRDLEVRSYRFAPG
jgi:hypothetical protein